MGDEGTMVSRRWLFGRERSGKIIPVVSFLESLAIQRAGLPRYRGEAWLNTLSFRERGHVAQNKMKYFKERLLLKERKSWRLF